MKSSQYLQKIGNNNGMLCFSSLLGNLFLLEQSDIEVLNSFLLPKNISKEKMEKSPISDFIAAKYLVENNDEERDFLEQRNKEWMQLIPNGGRVRLLNLMISETCNFGCPHCLHKCSIESTPSHGQKKLMGWEIAKKSIDLYANLIKYWGRYSLNVSFGSAEPLLNWNILQKSVEYIRNIGVSAKLAINTNLSLLDYKKAIFLRDNHVYISTSLDGPVEGNDVLRFFSNGDGTYSKIISNFELLQKIDYPLDGFSITINDRNFDYVTPKFIQWASNQGFKGIATDIDIINIKDMHRLLDDYIDKLMELRKACLEFEIENFGSWITPYYNLVNGADDNMATFCKAAKGQNISINPEGKIFICGHTTTSIGNIKSFENTFIVGNPYFKLVKSRLPGNDPLCKECAIEGICSGQCQITREMTKNSGNNKVLVLCNFFRKVTLRLLEEKLKTELFEERR